VVPEPGHSRPAGAYQHDRIKTARAANCTTRSPIRLQPTAAGERVHADECRALAQSYTPALSSADARYAADACIVSGVVGYPTVPGNDLGSVDPRELSTRREPVRLAAGRKALHVDNLALANGEDHEPIPATIAGCTPGCGRDDLVADLSELRCDFRWTPATTLIELKLQGLPGLVRPSSTRSLFPPQVPGSEAAPLAALVDQSQERLDVSLVQRLDRDPQLVDHDRDRKPTLNAADSRGPAVSRERAPLSYADHDRRRGRLDQSRGRWRYRSAFLGAVANPATCHVTRGELPLWLCGR
jgi:hypothetical protein